MCSRAGVTSTFLVSFWGGGFPGGSVVKNLPAMQETRVQSLGRENPGRRAMASCSIPAVLCVNGGLLACPVHSLQQPCVAALVSCLLNERELSVHSLHLRPGESSRGIVGPGLEGPSFMFLCIPKECCAVNFFNTHGGSWPGVSRWPLGCLKKDVCDSLRLIHWLSSVVFLISQKTFGK